MISIKTVRSLKVERFPGGLGEGLSIISTEFSPAIGLRELLTVKKQTLNDELASIHPEIFKHEQRLSVRVSFSGITA
ncbi:MAG: hypothetical protein Q8904_05565 [Bacteroidota bacterium]|nr:hypothetical protein [Bacteroidota bacterium]